MISLFPFATSSIHLQALIPCLSGRNARGACISPLRRGLSQSWKKLLLGGSCERESRLNSHMRRNALSMHGKARCLCVAHFAWLQVNTAPLDNTTGWKRHIVHVANYLVLQTIFPNTPNVPQNFEVFVRMPFLCTTIAFSHLRRAIPIQNRAMCSCY